MPMDYAFEKLYTACETAIGSGETLQQRVAGAMLFNVHLLKADEFRDKELWKRVEKLIEATTCEPAKRNEGTIVATTSKMTDEEASEWLREMMAVFSEVARGYGRDN
jgi:hypothetical protein